MSATPCSPTPENSVHTLARDSGAAIAYRHRAALSSGHGANVLFCGGFHSEMAGNKASALDAFSAARGVGYTRFDYQGHGRSSGQFEEGGIGLWFEDALAILDRVATGPQLVVGSSMGAWIALLLARARPERVKALVLIAPATDFTTRLMWPSLPEEARRAIEDLGIWHRPSEFEDDAYPLTRHLFEEARGHHLLDGPPIPFDGPVHILHGDRDEVVPVAHAQLTADALRSRRVVTSIIKDGDHRLSTPANLDLLFAAITSLMRQI